MSKGDGKNRDTARSGSVKRTAEEMKITVVRIKTCCGQRSAAT
jgi:hypothetical protein